jgi:uncharacterized membrane protein
MKISRMLPAAAMVMGSLAFTAAPAAAAPMMAGSAPLATSSSVQQVQWRHGGYRGGGWHHRGWGHGYHRRGYGWGPAIGGLAAGAIIGGAIANSQAQARGADADAYCSQRFRSYDPASGTYLGYDGDRHPCP